jgi:hypothetical protein
MTRADSIVCLECASLDHIMTPSGESDMYEHRQLDEACIRTANILKHSFGEGWEVLG